MKQTELMFAVMVLCVFFVSSPLSGEADEPARPDSASEDIGLRVGEMYFCAAVKDRAPIGVADTFPADIFSICCYTRILGAKDTVAVVHSWHRGGRRENDVKLDVRSSQWRTWSRKKMAPQLRGDWRVDVVAPDSSIIASKKFFLE